jgi:uncharacterized protein YjbJ (UPF0337 family)
VRDCVESGNRPLVLTLPPKASRHFGRCRKTLGGARFLLRRSFAAARGEQKHSLHVHFVANRQTRKSNQKECDMNWDRVEGNWKQFKGQAQQQWGNLTNDDLDVVEGKRKELSGKIQERYGVAKDEAEKQIDDWLKRVN